MAAHRTARPRFKLVTDIRPKGDQPKAIEALAAGVARGERFQTLLGVTGSGKTFTLANVIAAVQKPTLVIAHNKTLAAQLYGEFRDLFPDNAVEFFVSYYDYYQPEAYLPATDTYIEKETIVNDEIERMRHSATRSLGVRDDVIVVASVSCIYGLGGVRAYLQLAVDIRAGEDYGRERLLQKLVEAHYQRSDADFHRGTFRVRGDTVDVFPACEQELAFRIEFFGDRVERIAETDPLRGGKARPVDKALIYPASHYAAGETERRRNTCGAAQQVVRAARDQQDRRGRTAGKPHAAGPRDARTIRLLPRHRELFAPSRRPCRGGSSAVSAGLLSAGLSRVPGREPSDRAAACRHVPRRPLPQADARQLWLPAAIGSGQSPASVS
jgi:excinuclease UvrABC helicase subunit UvrB